MTEFQFRLQKVLDTCKLKEDLIEVKLAELEKLAEAQRMNLIFLEQKKEEILSERWERRRNGATLKIEEEMLYEKCLEDLEIRLEKMKVYLRQLEDQVRRTREELVAAAIERKVVEKVKEKQHEEFTLEVARNDQKALDEIAVQNYLRR
ncbi:MAG: flagellar export protein FliJ [Candidatus Caldatribacteriaceae bacterium]